MAKCNLNWRVVQVAAYASASASAAVPASAAVSAYAVVAEPGSNMPQLDVLIAALATWVLVVVSRLVGRVGPWGAEVHWA